MLERIVNEIRCYEGVTRKQRISEVVEALRAVADFGSTVLGPGDDCGVLKDGDGYLLLAADGIWPKFLKQEPYAAGKAAVIVGANDIYAMGGRPLAMVNVVAGGEGNWLREVLRGIKEGCQRLRVPMVGGHFHPEADECSLSVATLGRANKLLTSNSAEVNDELIIALDLRGEAGRLSTVKSWDAFSGTPPEELRYRLEALVSIAESGFARAAKDISNPGILGSISTLLESSKKGGYIEIERIPRPSGVSLLEWLKVFPSYGFILSAGSQDCSRCLQIFRERGVAAEVIGKVTDDLKIELNCQGREAVLFDFSRERITGIG